MSWYIVAVNFHFHLWFIAVFFLEASFQIHFERRTYVDINGNRWNKIQKEKKNGAAYKQNTNQLKGEKRKIET